MGCGSSSPRIGFSSRSNRNPIANSYPGPNPNPVYLCRDRTKLISSACDRRYAAAAAHVAYLRALSTLGESLCQFAASELSTSAPGSPVLTLPTSSKGKSKAESDPGSGSGSSTVTPLSHSLSFGDDEEEENLNPNSSIATPLTHDLSVEDKQVEQKPQSISSRKLEEGSRPSTKINNMASSSTMPSVTNSYPPYAYDYSYGNGYGYGYGYETTNSNPNFGDRPGPSNPATPPMPVPESSGWEFLDPFSNYDQFMERYEYFNSNSYDSSPDSIKVRMREGIPDLEDEIKFEEKQKEIEREKKREKENENTTEKEKEKEDEKDNSMGPTISVATEKTRSISTEEGSGGKNKEVRFDDEKKIQHSNSDNGPDLSVAVELRDLCEVIEEIKVQFDSVADCAKEVSDILEVGKVQYRSGPLGAISSRILDPTLPILPTSCLPHKRLAGGKTGSAGWNSTAGAVNGNVNGLTQLSLSLTLDKLYVWEKRLYKEVKDEEKLRSEYERKYRQVKNLDEHGADWNVINSANEAVTTLRTRISVAIKSANTISSQIHRIRDEELQPQLIQLVQRFIQMWKSILDCHNKQLAAVKGLNTYNIKARIRSDPKLVARFTLQLEKDISKWHRGFENWIETQKSFIEALNGYLIRWIRNEPDSVEETLDGVPPFSPGRIGAPTSFVITNDWYQAVKTASEMKTLECIANFGKLVRQYRKLQEDESQYRMKAEHLSIIYRRRLMSLQDEMGIRIETGNMEIVSSNEKENMESAETGYPVLEHDRRVAQLMAIKRRRDDERERQKEAFEKLNEAGSGVLKTGLEPVFEQLHNLLSENLKAYEAVRVPDQE